MRIACLDKSARNRIDLQSYIEAAFKDCRTSVGHLTLARAYPCSKQELFLNSPPDAILLGSSYSLEELHALIVELRAEFEEIPMYLIFEEKDLEYKNILLFRNHVTEIFSKNESPVRLVYSLTHVGRSELKKKLGSLIVVDGVKGGVGATSIATGLAHAGQSLDRTVVVVDLSIHGDISQFFLCSSWQSPELAKIISDQVLAERKQIESIVLVAENQIPILRPPLGGDAIRERMLRNPQSLESSLSVIEALQEIYDVVIVDMAHSEGIFPFALECRADIRLFVCANEPGSIHLLTSKMDKYSLPVEGETRFLINETHHKGLGFEDVLDFVSWNKNFNDNHLYPDVIPFDYQASLWIGSGNSLYTEGSGGIQNALKSIFADALNIDFIPNKKKPFARTCFEALRRNKQVAIPLEERPKITYSLEDIVDG